MMREEIDQKLERYIEGQSQQKVASSNQDFSEVDIHKITGGLQQTSFMQHTQSFLIVWLLLYAVPAPIANLRNGRKYKTSPVMTAITNKGGLCLALTTL